MFKTILWLLAAAIAVPGSAADYGKPSTQRVCISRCIAGPLAEFPKLASRYEARIETIKSQQKTEKDPAQLEALAAELADIDGKIQAGQEKTCKFICRNNPDE